jgi:hypothetical protein
MQLASRAASRASLATMHARRIGPWIASQETSDLLGFAR